MARRKRRKFGSIRELPSGKFQAHFTHPNGERIKAPSTFETYGDAEGWLIIQEREIELKIWVHPDVRAESEKREAVTVGEWVNRWLAIKETEIEPTTVHGYRKTLNPRLLKADGSLARFRDLSLAEFTKAEAFSWWDEVTERFNTPPQNHLAYKHLRAACAAAVERDLIEDNPVDIKAATKKPKTKNKELATRAELQAIVDNILPRYRLAAVLCLFHGLRLGEALAVSDTDFSVNWLPVPLLPEVTVTVRKSLKDGAGGNHILKRPKTSAGYRDVPMMTEFVPVYLAHLVKFPPREDGIMTTTSRGNTVLSEVFRSALSTAKKHGGVDDQITPHYGRNWLITELAERGATPKEIGAILGQEDVATILNVYMKVKRNRPAELMRRLAL